MIVLSWIWGIVKSVLNTIARVVVFAVILVVILAGIGLVSRDGLPSNMVLELDAPLEKAPLVLPELRGQVKDFSFKTVRRRAMLRRTLVRFAVFDNCPVAFCMRRLNCSRSMSVISFWRACSSIAR